MTRFVLVPGANHGGWWYQPVVEALTAKGHRSRALTLAGLHPDGPPAPAANLDTHIAEVLDVLRNEPEPVVLVGHSYGGSVITGAADALPDAVSSLVYLDAFVPADGDTCWSMTTQWERDWYIDDSGETGLAVAPLPFFDARARPHPIGTLLQRSRLTGAWTRVRDRHYVLAADPQWLEQSPFAAVAERLRPDPQWRVIDVAATHNLLRGGPGLLVDLLLDIAAPRDPDHGR